MTIPGSAHPLLMASLAEPAAYQIDRSLRFNSADSANLTRTPSAAGNRRTWTLSFWIKDPYNASIENRPLFTYGSGASGNYLDIRFTAVGTFQMSDWSTYYIQTTDVFRDPSAWYHFVISVDTTLSTAADRVKLYVNGAQISRGGSDAGPNHQFGVNNNQLHCIGASIDSSGNIGSASNIYLAEYQLIDGQALAPTDFGAPDDNGVWQPKLFTGTYGWFNQSQTWSSLWTGTANYGSFVAVHNGVVSTANYMQSYSGATFTLPSALPVTSLRLYCQVYGTGGTVLVNGVDVTSQLQSSGIAHANITGVSSLSTINITGTDGNNLIGLYAIELNGKYLIDSGITGIADNSFHLDFADNSSNAALGTDTSGNSNTWTVNNLVAAGSNWNQSQTWSSSVTNENSTYTANKAFSGTISGSNLWGNNGSASVLTLSSALDISGKTVVVYGAAVSGANQILVNNRSITGWPTSTNSLAPLDITSQLSGDTTLTTIEVRASNAYFQGIEVDGKLLVNPGASDPLGATIDSLVDSPTNGTASSGGDPGGSIVGNYATLNPLITAATTTLSNGNLDMNGFTAYSSLYGTIGISSGKYYWETTYPDNGTMTGVAATPNGSQYPGQASDSYAVDNANKYNNSAASSFHSFAAGSVVGCAFDADNGTLTYYDDGVSAGTAFTSIPAGTYFPIFRNGLTNVSVNFGQRAFHTAAPAGYKSLNTANLPEPTIADGSKYFDTKLYTGNGGTTSVNYSFSPDFVWLKGRSETLQHRLVDIVRGDKQLNSNSTAAESNFTVLDFESDGFDITNDGNEQNKSGTTYAAWAWDAGTSTVTNNDGSITSQVRANPSAGFSIVKATIGSGSVGHGLNAVPSFVITKTLGSGIWWTQGHVYSNPAANYQRLNTTVAVGTDTSAFNNTAATSTTFNFNSNYLYGSSQECISYCFAPVEGYSAFGSYTGNGSTDGPFVFTGFRPRWIIFKCSSTDNNYTFWEIIDTARDNNLAADLSDAEGSYNLGTGVGVDILSNGFKIRGAGSGKNLNTQTYIYAAFAENPFQANGGLAR
jgi:hypothetical protein